MVHGSYKLANSIAATCAPLLLALPSYFDAHPYDLSSQQPVSYKPFVIAGYTDPTELFRQHVYWGANEYELFMAVARVAGSILSESRELDPDFAKIVDKQFWNLLS